MNTDSRQLLFIYSKRNTLIKEFRTELCRLRSFRCSVCIKTTLLRKFNTKKLRKKLLISYFGMISYLDKV